MADEQLVCFARYEQGGIQMSFADVTDVATVVKDVVIALAALIGAWVAVQGLSTWKRQLKGSVEYELTRRLLRTTYRWRESIKAVRSPMVWAQEMPAPSDEERKSMSEAEIQHYGYATAYQRRWDKVVEARDALQTELLEAEVLWGKQVLDIFSSAFELQRELYVYIYTRLESENPRTRPGMREAKERVLEKRRNVMYDFSTPGEEDEFSRDLSTAISGIESFLQPHLRK